MELIRAAARKAARALGWRVTTVGKTGTAFGSAVAVRDTRPATKEYQATVAAAVVVFLVLVNVDGLLPPGLFLRVRCSPNFAEHSARLGDLPARAFGRLLLAGVVLRPCSRRNGPAADGRARGGGACRFGVAPEANTMGYCVKINWRVD
ncbi:hypothetical protein [Streptomyces alboflavus]|uniref:hypothetical protein n=1 Tax=Streptomyces alboflavus TaxID=67267 RepID=UPI0013319B9D|nr:hypothetical protein [Streptomyces alboflavus]